MKAIYILIIYWFPIYLYLLIYSIKIRIYVKKYNIKSLDTVHPTTYKIGKLTDHQKLGVVLLYTVATILGFFTFFMLPKNMISKNILPDD